MNQISSNTNNNYRLKQAQMSFKANEQLPIEQPVQSEKTIDLSQVQIPDLYYTPEDSFQQQGFKETLKKADVMGLIYPWVAHPLMMLGTCAGLAYGVDKFSKACSGDYEKSLLGKAAKFGDSVENSKFVQSRPVQGVLGGIKKTGKGLAYVFRNNQLVNAFKKTPAKPEWQMPKHEMARVWFF